MISSCNFIGMCYGCFSLFQSYGPLIVFLRLIFVINIIEHSITHCSGYLHVILWECALGKAMCRMRMSVSISWFTSYAPLIVFPQKSCITHN